MLIPDSPLEQLCATRIVKKITKLLEGRHDPLWSRLENAIFRALLPFAEARAAVSLALAEVDSA